MTVVPSLADTLARTQLEFELDERGDPDSLRAVLAVREFTRGNLSLASAVDLAGMAEADFVALLARSNLSEYRDPSADGIGGQENRPRLSVVVPLHNEEENLAVLHERLSAVLEPIGRHEIVFVDDGSRDRSAEVVLELKRRDPAVRLVRFTRNFGKEAALAAGLDHARGEAVVIMDADLQDPPELLPKLVEQWMSGYQVVYAVRTKRKESAWKRAGYHWFYRIQKVVAELDMPLDAGDFCLMDRSVVEVLRRMPEQNRFLRGLRAWTGFKQIGVTYDRPTRHAGDTKFTLRKLIKTGVDGLMAFTSLPLRIASYAGFLLAAAGTSLLGVAGYSRLFTEGAVAGWIPLVATLLLIGGSQLIFAGVIGMYVARVYDETKRRPAYVVAPTSPPFGST